MLTCIAMKVNIVVHVNNMKVFLLFAAQSKWKTQTMSPFHYAEDF